VKCARAVCSVKRWKRIGPFICASVGALFYVVGFLGLYGAATKSLPAPMWLLAVLAYLASNGGTWLEAAALATCVSNFETERGAVIGILKSFLGAQSALLPTAPSPSPLMSAVSGSAVQQRCSSSTRPCLFVNGPRWAVDARATLAGLSASVYTTLYMTLCSKELDFLLLLATVPTAVALVCSLGVNLVPFRQLEPHSKAHAFHIAMNATVSLAVYQLVSALYFRMHRGPEADNVVRAAPHACLLLFAQRDCVQSEMQHLSIPWLVSTPRTRKACATQQRDRATA
jgi:Nodulin-like